METNQDLSFGLVIFFCVFLETISLVSLSWTLKKILYLLNIWITCHVQGTLRKGQSEVGNWRMT
jgi:hypothetical protein